jgi:hypothetical protein
MAQCDALDVYKGVDSWMLGQPLLLRLAVHKFRAVPGQNALDAHMMHRGARLHGIMQHDLHMRSEPLF